MVHAFEQTETAQEYSRKHLLEFKHCHKANIALMGLQTKILTTLLVKSYRKRKHRMSV
jgi:hypothetical protein